MTKTPRFRLPLRVYRCKAVTLTELLVVVTIVLILAALLFPALKRGIDAARRSACLGNLRALGAAVTSYAGENRGFLPATYNFRQLDSEGASFDTMNSWSAAIDPYLPLPPGTSSARSAYRCPANPIRGRNYTIVHGVARFSTSLWEPRKNLFKLDAPSKVPYLTDGPQHPGLLLGRPTRATDTSMDYVVLSPGASGATAIRTRTGPDNPMGTANYWIPPHDGGNSLNILYVDGSVRSVSVPFFINDDPVHGFFSENIIPEGNPNPNL